MRDVGRQGVTSYYVAILYTLCQKRKKYGNQYLVFIAYDRSQSFKERLETLFLGATGPLACMRKSGITRGYVTRYSPASSLASP